MSTTHIHLLLNHFPVIGTMIGSSLLLWGIVKKQPNVKSIAAVVLLLMAIVAIPVYLTGEPAEESVEKLPGVSGAMIELHEDAATIAIWLMGITGAAALTALFFAWQKRKTAGAVFMTVFILSVLCSGVMARAGYYGGQVRHTEIRDNSISTQQNEKAKGQGDDLKEKDD